MKKTTAKSDVWVPTLAQLLGTIAGHVAHIMTYAPGRTVSDLRTVRLGCGVGGFPGTDCPLVIVDGTITRVADDSDGGAWGDWAQVVFDGRSVGNRYGAVRAYTEAVAPVVAWVAAYWAAKAAAAVAAANGPAVAKAAS